jgi:hypothetical protein
MTIPLDLIDGIQIAKPCPASWEQMVGNDRIRHCLICAQNVYDISAMTAEEAREFLGSHDEDVCIRLYRRPDGTVMTRDCPKGIRSQIRAFVSRVAISAVSMLGIFSLWGGGDSIDGNEKKGRTMGKPCIPNALPQVNPQAVPPGANGDQERRYRLDCPTVKSAPEMPPPN